jgi:uncharacterized protein YdaU (DUF1376 family)
MSKYPSMPLFIDAYLADTTHLTAEEHGAYLLLLMAMWRRNGSVPNDDHDLARICCVAPKRWSRVKQRLMPFLRLTGADELTQKRLLGTIENVRKRVSQNAVSDPPKVASDRHVNSKENNDLFDFSRARVPIQNQKGDFPPPIAGKIPPTESEVLYVPRETANDPTSPEFARFARDGGSLTRALVDAVASTMKQEEEPEPEDYRRSAEYWRLMAGGLKH